MLKKIANEQSALKNKITRNPFMIAFISVLACTLLLLITGCRQLVQEIILDDYKQTNLVADVSGFGAARIDTGLVNAWGIAVAPSGPFWLAANHTGLSPVYDKTGATLRPSVTIPGPDGTGSGAPTGVVFNSTTDFVIWSGKQPTPSKFIFATEDGTIAAWAGGSAAVIVANRSSQMAVYKGLALANDGGSNFLYATNFRDAKVDVFDKDFNLVTTKPFHDPTIPAGFAPFNIRLIGKRLFVTYALQKPNKMDDQSGPGNGYVDIYGTNGMLIKRFASQGALNSPWGMVESGTPFCNLTHAILVGNFGDGRINMYDDDGKFVGPLQNKDIPIVIQGLWALENDVPKANPKQLFFTAGPVEETHGLFGYLMKTH
ncbi:uncharacterized protein (TIGR03118 family) [Chitinophaga niastensis]|uniref:Uncharacterized protein (TIGR03118 family) n=1 Tax=Chitinophaga niastensis TaxID=536980 RepID=A0A2P8HVX3_CHINA|nr:TIGR03118 family protein [Chitinophaga niastensis]PSL50325.1 uncharacterized protein (TIGR03118 family) [Chitinophaga niastensis]